MYHIDHRSKINMIFIYIYFDNYLWYNFHPDTVTVTWITTDTLDTVTSCSGHYYLMYCIIGTQSLLLHVLVSSLHGHFSTLDAVFHVNTHYTRYCYSMYMYHCYTDTDTHDTIIMSMNHWYTDTLLYWIPLHGYSVHYYFMFFHYCYIDSLVYMWLIISIFLLHGSLLLLYELLLHGYSCIPIIWLFSITDIDIYYYWTC